MNEDVNKNIDEARRQGHFEGTVLSRLDDINKIVSSLNQSSAVRDQRISSLETAISSIKQSIDAQGKFYEEKLKEAKEESASVSKRFDTLEGVVAKLVEYKTTIRATVAVLGLGAPLAYAFISKMLEIYFK